MPISKSDKKFMLIVLFIFLALFFLGFGITGKVLDSKTNKPIANAYVVVSWVGDGIFGFELSTYCVKSMVARTNSKGRYYFPFWVKPLSSWDVVGIGPTISVYKQGLVEDKETNDHSPDFMKTVYLKKYVGTREDRLGYLLNFSEGCRDSEGTKGREMLGNSLYLEAENLMSVQNTDNARPSKMEKILFDAVKTRHSKIDK